MVSSARQANRAELLDEVWRFEPDVVSRTVDVHILELRRKLEMDPPNPWHILTVRKIGYRLVRGPETDDRAAGAGTDRLQSTVIFRGSKCRVGPSP